MAATKTTYVAPDLWKPYAQEAMVASNDLLAIGVTEFDSSPPVSESGEFMTQAYQQSLDNAGNLTQIVADTTAVTPEAMLDFSIITPVEHYGKGFTEAEYTRLVRGVDPIRQLGTQLGTYFAKQKANKLIQQITAHFETSGCLLDQTGTEYNHVLNPGTELTPDALYDAQAKFGENSGDLNVLICNSLVRADFVKNQVVKEYPMSDLTNSILSTGKFTDFNGIRIIVNDTLCTLNSTTGKYSSYLLSGQPFYMGEVTPLTEKIKEDAATGGGTLQYYYYFRIAPAVKGISYTAGTYPATDALLGTATSFTLKWNTKLVKLVQINTALLA